MNKDKQYAEWALKARSIAEEFYERIVKEGDGDSEYHMMIATMLVGKCIGKHAHTTLELTLGLSLNAWLTKMVAAAVFDNNEDKFFAMLEQIARGGKFDA